MIQFWVGKRLMKIKCSNCKRLGDWFAGPYGPFCSKRCKLVDLGRWFGEEHCITEPLSAEDFETPSEDPDRLDQPHSADSE
jgi:endogenous inhibitor of DNA gyrase (YacG/DUF329 family)